MRPGKRVDYAAERVLLIEEMEKGSRKRVMNARYRKGPEKRLVEARVEWTLAGGEGSDFSEVAPVLGLAVHQTEVPSLLGVSYLTML